jgi:transcriptional regulator with XRE-family HTH domain
MEKSISARGSTRGGSPEQVFGRVLRSVRESQALSQEELGFRSGYHRTYIGQLERGEKSASLRTIVNLAATLNIRPSLLIRRMERDLSKPVPKTP